MSLTSKVLAAATALTVAVGFGFQAHADNLPKLGPVPGWVDAAPAVPTELDSAKGLPLAILMTDTQFAFDADVWTEYHDVQLKVQSAVGLQAVGNIPFQWSPWSDTLTFHSASIIRDGQAFDVLPKEGAFTVLRRETGLAQATLTGELTALLQPDGLQVGDVLEFKVSIRHAATLFRGKPSALFAGWDTAPVGRARIEAHWPSSLPIRMRQTANFPKVVRREQNGVISVSLTLDDLRPPVLPAQAPLRFQHGRQLEFTTFTDWNDVAQLMAPLYAKAAELGPQSPVSAQAQLIATQTADPKARAALALQLVQGTVRYLAHIEAEGSFTPQSADDTWRIRSGDCKAKTVLLIALLRELGVPADPVMVSIAAGDTLHDHLPAPLFDHVFVRVHLDGHDYWLDGAREGDRNLDDLTVPAYGWVLPLSPSSTLVHLTPTGPSEAQMLQVIRYDASGGVTAPEPTDLKTTYRGDLATIFHAQMSAVPPDRLDAALKAYWASVHTAFTAAHVAAAWDPVKGEETLTADGTSKLDWSGYGLELENVALGGEPNIKRDPQASDQDAPYLVAFPNWVETDESVVLPPGSHPSANSAKAADVDMTIAGIAYHRSATITGNVFRVVASQRSLQPEISAAEAKASVDPLTKLGNSIYAPAGSQAQAANDAQALDSRPTTVDGHLQRGSALLNARKFEDAIVEYDAAIAIDARSQDGWAGRAIAHAWLSKPEALTDADRADSFGKPNIVAARARGLLAYHTWKLDEAVTAFRRALLIDPDDAFSLTHLVEAEVRVNKTTEARNDLATLLKAHPNLANAAHLWRAEIEAADHHEEAAKRELALADVSTPEALLSRARAYAHLGDKDLARADVDAANRMKPSAAAWLLRASLDGGLSSDTSLAEVDADADAALKLSPDNLDAELWKVNAASVRQDYTGALTLLAPLIPKHPEAAGNLLVGRAQIESKLGLKAEAEIDFAQARQITGTGAAESEVLCNAEVGRQIKTRNSLSDCERALTDFPKSLGFKVAKAVIVYALGDTLEADKILDEIKVGDQTANELNSACYSLAVNNVELDRALTYCDAALKLKSDSAAVLDSRAFVLLRQRRNEESLVAYNAALAIDPKAYNSLYGRGLVEARLGRNDDSRHDISLAEAGRPPVRADFAAMGVLN